MFCKVCYDANKSGFDTHNIKDCYGSVICPYLLSITCFKCGQNGHTPRYCKGRVIQQDNSILNCDDKKINNTTKKNDNPKKVVHKNLFMCLLSDDDSDNEFDEYHYLNKDNVIWGQGFRDMIGVKWSDM